MISASPSPFKSAMAKLRPPIYAVSKAKKLRSSTPVTPSKILTCGAPLAATAAPMSVTPSPLTSPTATTIPPVKPMNGGMLVNGPAGSAPKIRTSELAPPADEVTMPTKIRSLSRMLTVAVEPAARV